MFLAIHFKFHPLVRFDLNSDLDFDLEGNLNE